MSKGQALAATIVSGILTILVLFSGWGTCALTGFVVTLVFGLVWWVKYERDARILQEAYANPMPAISQVPVAPSMTSLGSIGLKVPPPLD